MKYAHYDKKTNEILGYYDDEIHNTIPTPNFEISNDAWQKALSENANIADAKNQKLVRVEVEQEKDELAELNKAIKEVEDDIRRAILIGNDSVLPELREEYKKLLAEKQTLEKGDNKDEKEN